MDLDSGFWILDYGFWIPYKDGSAVRPMSIACERTSARAEVLDFSARNLKVS